MIFCACATAWHKLVVYLQLITKTYTDMAQIYTIKCPKCGRTFEVTKGPLVSEMDKPLPEERREDTPAICPVCKLAIDLQDPANEKYIVSVLMVD